MSEVKNGFPDGSNIYTRCVYSKYGEFDRIPPQGKLSNLHQIGGSEGYMVLQALYCSNLKAPIAVPSDIKTTYNNDKYDVISTYDSNNYIWKIEAALKKGDSISKKILNFIFGIIGVQIDVNVEIGPKAPLI